MNRAERRRQERKARKQPGQNAAQPSPQALMARAVELHAQGNIAQAEPLYRQVLAAQPGHPHALHFLGRIALQVGKFKDAAKLIGQSLERQPENPPAQVERGIALRELGQLNEAIAHFQRATELAPDMGEAFINLGSALFERSRFDEAVTVLKRAVTLSPRQPSAHYTLGLAHRALGHNGSAANALKTAWALAKDDLDVLDAYGETLFTMACYNDAIAVYRHALQLAPKSSDYHFKLGQAHLMAEANLGAQASENAVSCFKDALALDADFGAARTALGIAQAQSGDFANARQTFRAQYDNVPNDASNLYHLALFDDWNAPTLDLAVYLHALENASSDGDRVNLNFAIGKALEKQGDFDGAFDHYERANALKFRQLENQTDRLVDAMKVYRRFFEDHFADAPQATEPSGPAPIFIVGMPRSGTTLVEQILAAHPSVRGLGELFFLDRAVLTFFGAERATDIANNFAQADTETIAQAGQWYLDQIDRDAAERPYFTDKQPQNFMYLPIIRRMLPKAKFVHIQRDPMDTCLSNFVTNFSDDRLPFACRLEDLGRFYNAYLDTMATWRSLLGADMLDIRYEELVESPEPVVREMLTYLDLPWDDECLQFHKSKRSVATASATQVRQPIYTSSVGGWKRFERQLAPLKQILDERGG